MKVENQHVEALQDIRRIMQRSSRFLSLSGLSGIAAGVWALVGSWFAYDWIVEYYNKYNATGYTNEAFSKLKWNLVGLALIVLFLALVSAFYFTWRRTRKDGVKIWDRTARNLTINMMIPLVAGGIMILSMLTYDEWRFVAPLSLVFYGLALVNASKYTLPEIRYLGICEIILGLVCTRYISYGLYFWTIGFGVLHIIYGFIMWWRNERIDDINKVR